MRARDWRISRPQGPQPITAHLMGGFFGFWGALASAAREREGLMRTPPMRVIKDAIEPPLRKSRRFTSETCVSLFMILPPGHAPPGKLLTMPETRAFTTRFSDGAGLQGIRTMEEPLSIYMSLLCSLSGFTFRFYTHVAPMALFDGREAKREIRLETGQERGNLQKRGVFHEFMEHTLPDFSFPPDATE